MNQSIRTDERLSPDPVFPRRDLMLDARVLGETLAARFGADVSDVAIARVKYRPRKSLRVLFTAVTDGARAIFSARMFAGDAVGVTHDRAAVLMPELGIAVWRFPDDRKIARISAGPDRELVAYAPEKCATFRIRNEKREIAAYEKVFADAAAGERLFGVYRSLFEAAPRGLVPETKGYSVADAALRIAPVHGIRLADITGANQFKAHAEFGRAIARLHELPVPPALARFSRHDREKIIATVHLVAETMPAHLAAAKGLAAKLIDAAEPFQAPRVLHGDLHAKNVIFPDDGVPTLIDLDQSAAGDAASDIGSFLAGLIYREVCGEISVAERRTLTTGFLSGYESNGLPVDRKRLSRAIATALFTERAARSITRIRTPGIRNFGRILAVAESVLAGGVR